MVPHAPDAPAGRDDSGLDHERDPAANDALGEIGAERDSLLPENYSPQLATASGSNGNTSHHDDEDEVSLNSEDDYITSDEDLLTTVMSSDDQRHHFAYGSTFAEHTEYFSKSLSYALDSVKLDKSLVAQAQLSGHLNNKSQKLAEKHEELLDKISTLRNLYRDHLSSNRMGELEKDLADLTSRIDRIKNGLPKTLLFGRKGTVGVAEKYPIEYNQAKDKVLERVSD